MFVEHHFAKGGTLPDLGLCLYDYVVAQNGVIVRARRPRMSAGILTNVHRLPIRGLDTVQPYLTLIRRVPANLLLRFLRNAYAARPYEHLAYLRYTACWELTVPRQQATPTGVRPIDPYDDAARDALIEIHSHGDMPAFFSQTDDLDESNAFRIYAVVGRISNNRPQIAVRVGIYGHFWIIPADWVFDLPPFVVSCHHPLQHMK